MRTSGTVQQLTYIKRQIPEYEILGEEGMALLSKTYRVS